VYKNRILRMVLLKYFQHLPTNIVNYILEYDKRFVIRKGEAIAINPLNKKKYKKIIDLLSKKPRICVSNMLHIVYNLDAENYVKRGYNCSVLLPNNFTILYTICLIKETINFQFSYKYSKYSSTRVLHCANVL
jgi:hypothetical protein